jgi:hypothetical protein
VSTFALDTYRLASIAPRSMTAIESQYVQAGRSAACEIIDALRAGHWEEIDPLQAALAIIEPAGPEVLRGFLREIADAIRDGAVQ